MVPSCSGIDVMPQHIVTLANMLHLIDFLLPMISSLSPTQYLILGFVSDCFETRLERTHRARQDWCLNLDSEL